MRKWSVISAVYVLALILLWVYTGQVEMEHRSFVVVGYGLTWGALRWSTCRLDLRGLATARAVDSFEVAGGEE